MLTLKQLNDRAYDQLDSEITSLVVEDLTERELTRLGSVITDIVRLCDQFKYHKKEKVRWYDLNKKAREKLMMLMNYYEVMERQEKDHTQLSNQLRVLSKVSFLYLEELRMSGYKNESIVDNEETANAILDA